MVWISQFPGSGTVFSSAQMITYSGDPVMGTGAHGHMAGITIS